MKKGRKKSAALTIQAEVKIIPLTDTAAIDAWYAAIKQAILLAYNYDGKETQPNG